MKLTEGCMWDGGEWEIAFDYECSNFGGDGPCRHCHSDRQKQHDRANGTHYFERVWICPRVIIAYNEGGFSSTGVCADCVLDAVRAPDPAGVSAEGAAWAMEQQCTCRVIDGKHDPHCPGGGYG